MLSAIVPLTLAVALTQAPPPDLTQVRVTSASLRATVALDGNETPGARTDQDTFKRAVRDWVEAHFSSGTNDYLALARRLDAEITQAGLHAKEGEEQPDPAAVANPYGTVASFDITTDPAFKDGFIVTVAVGVFCGSDESVYAYRRTKSGVARILEAATTNRVCGEALSRLSFSSPDGDGNQLALLTTIGTQCASNWNIVRYRLFRIPPGEAPGAAAVFDESHGSFEASEQFESDVLPDEFTVEMRDRSIDNDLHSRTHYLRYRVSGASVERVDPVALQAQDFVDEWVTRPWTEMESRSAATSRETLGKWHKVLHADYVGGTFTLAQPCRDTPGLSQYGVEFGDAGGHEWPEPLQVFFLVREQGNGTYQMLDVSFARQEGCPGEGEPRGESPWRRLKK